MKKCVITIIKYLGIFCILVFTIVSMMGCYDARILKDKEELNDKYNYNAVIVYFDGNGGTVDTLKKAVLIGEKYGELPSAELKGCDFDGWYTDIYEGVEVKSTDVMPSGVDDIVLYARFKSKPGQWRVEGLRYYYTDSEGYVPKNEWRYIDEHWFYFDKIGRAVIGWQKIDGETYYMEVDGKMATGWKRYNGDWYYLNEYPLGNMAIGWQNIGDRWYLFDDNGKRVTGWIQLGLDWYYFDLSGSMQTGWQEIKGNKYYFDEDGIMCHGVCKIKGKVYCFDENGALIRDAYIPDGYVNKEGIFEGNKS